MALDSLKSELKKILQEQETPSVCERLMACLSDKSNFYNVVLVRKSEFENLDDQYMMGTVTDEDYRVGNQKIKDILLKVIDRLTTNDVVDDSDAFTQLLVEANVHTKKLGKIFLVNCDRREPMQQFKDFFKLHKTQPFQFYFIVADPTQEPDSFAERLVYEIMETFAIDFEAIDYERDREFQIKGKPIERVLTNKLPLGGDLEASQKFFKRYFAERLKTLGMENVSLEDFVTDKAAQLTYKYINFNFKISAENLDAEAMNYMAWLVKTFQHNRKDLPSFIFSFVINMKDAHRSADQTVMDLLKKMIAENAEACVLVDKLSPIAENDLLDWLENDVDIRKYDLVKKITRRFVDDLKLKENLTTDTLDMMHVEPLQELVYHVSNR